MEVCGQTLINVGPQAHTHAHILTWNHAEAYRMLSSMCVHTRAHPHPEWCGGHRILTHQIPE